MTYIKDKNKSDHCVFCLDKNPACKEYILSKGEKAFVLMNLYPYTSGHIMVLPYRHIATIEGLDADERTEMFDLVALSVKVLKKALSPDGFNVGINLGNAAGAGLEDHLHIHIVPRWNGDNNFMSVVGEVRVIPEGIVKTWEKLKSYFDHADEEE